jgi:hypothetical protein
VGGSAEAFLFCREASWVSVWEGGGWGYACALGIFLQFTRLGVVIFITTSLWLRR